jgi:class 3 adenylate cyclase
VGEKARFQLFGDAVNTTTRVESTSGKNNRIHASSATANLLIQAGKGHWVKPREDKIVAKGKGEMTTFWIDPNRNPSVISGGSYRQRDDDSDRARETF